MKAKVGKNYFASYAKRISRAIQKDQYEMALRDAAMAYTVATDIEDDQAKQMFLRAFRVPVSNLLAESDKDVLELIMLGKRCSFCPRTEKDARIMKGTYGSICEVCASEAHDYFKGLRST